jgi:hypothetical protein
MKRGEVRELLKEMIKTHLSEVSTTGTGATFTPGAGEQYATPFAFSKDLNNRAVQFLKKMGFKKAERPKRPSSTKLVDYRQ